LREDVIRAADVVDYLDALPEALELNDSRIVDYLDG